MKKLVVIGGGFAGSYIARKLENEFDITLVDPKNYFEYTPGILRTIVNPDHLSKIQAQHKDYLKKAKIVLGSADHIEKDFIIAGGKKIEYDYLAICSGSKYVSPIKDGTFYATRAHVLKEHYSKLKKSKSILIVGGGLVGVELAAEICTHYKDKKITLIHSGEKLIPRNNDKSSKYAYNFLTRHGVEIVFNQMVLSSKNKVFLTSEQRKIKSDLTCMCTGIKPNFEFMKNSFLKNFDEKGFIVVNDYLQVKGEKNIFAAGDITSILEEKTAQNARKHARLIIRNLRALERGKKLKKYKSKNRLMVISLGKYDGVFEYGNFVFGGIIPGLLKWLIEKNVMFEYGELF